MKRTLLDEFWPNQAPMWQIKLDAGESLTDRERRNFAKCVEAWANEGYARTKSWSLKDIAAFKRRWKAQLVAWEKKEREGEPFGLKERKEQQLGLGSWSWIGYQESAAWDNVAWRSFQENAAKFAANDQKLSETSKLQTTKASRQIWIQIGLDYLDRPLRHRQQGEFNQGAWRRNGECHQAAFEAQRLKRESSIAKQIVGWKDRGLQHDDYYFRWASQVEKNVEDGHMALRLAVLYEYAREGRKLRGLLLVLNPARKRKPWEAYHRESFEGLDEQEARSGLYEMIDVLAFLAQPLAANVPYAEVLRSQPRLIDRALAHGKHLHWMRLRNGISTHWKLKTPVELAWKQELAETTTFDTLAWGGKSHKKTDSHPALPPRQIKNGKEVIAFRVDWANYRDEHLKERIGELLRWLRRTRSGMGRSIPPEPKPNKKGKKAGIWDKALNCLRAARVLDHCHGKSPSAAWQMLGLSQTASDKETSNFYRDAAKARREFKQCFPYEVGIAHHKTPSRNRR